MAKTRIDIETSGVQKAQKDISTIEGSLRELEGASQDALAPTQGLFENSKGAIDFIKRAELARQSIQKLSKSYQQFGSTVTSISSDLEKAELTQLFDAHNTEEILSDLQRIGTAIEDVKLSDMLTGYEDQEVAATLDLIVQIEKSAKEAAEAAQKFEFPQEAVDRWLDRMKEARDIVEENVGPEGVVPQRSFSEGLQQFGGSTARISRSLSGIGGNFGIEPLRGVGDFLSIGDDLPEIISGFSELRGVLLASTVVLGSVSVLYAAVKHEIEEANKALHAWISTMPQVSAVTYDFFQILTEGTQITEDALKQEAEIKRELLEQQIATLESFLTQYDDALAERFSGPGAIALKFLGADADEAKNKVKELQLALDETNSSISYLNSNLVQSNIEINQFVADMQEARAAQIEIAQLIAFSSTEELKRKKKELEINTTATRGSLTSIEQQVVQLFREMEQRDFGSIVDPAIDSFDELAGYLEAAYVGFEEGSFAASDFTTKMQILKALMGKDFSIQMTTLSEEAISASAELETYRQQMAQITEEIEPQVAAREREEKILERATEAETERAQVLEEIASLEQSINELYAERAKQEATENQIKSLEEFHDRQLDAIDARIAEAEALERYQAMQKELGDLEEETRVKREDLDKKYLADSLKRSKQFIREEKLITDKANLERLRKLQDLEDDLFRLASDNDFAGFIERQKEGLKELGRDDQDASEETQLRREEFALQEEETREAHQQELTDLRDYYDERRGQILESYQEELTLVEQLQQQREALLAKQQIELEQLRELQEREAFYDRIRDLQQQQETLKAKFRALNEEIIRAGGQLGANAATSVLNGFQQQASGFLNSLTNSLSAAIQQAQAATASTSALAQGTVNLTAAPTKQRRTSGGAFYTAFEKGDILTEPTFGLLAENPRFGELVMPFEKSRGLEAALQENFGQMLSRGGKSVSIVNDFTGVNFGNLTRGDVEHIVDQAMWEVVEIIKQ